MLVELIDHKLLHKKEGEHGDEELFVPFSDDILEGIIEGLN
jgi:hypothetical protein